MKSQSSSSPFAEGDPNSKICIVAEAPGRNEIAFGRPLIGPAGKTFDSFLHTAGLIRQECYIANCIRTQIKSTETYVRKDGTLTEEGKKAQADLKERLEGTKANVYIAVGHLALCFLTDKRGINKWRGSILKSNLLEDRKVIPTLHPALVLPHRGNYLARYKIISDLTRVAEHKDKPDKWPIERDLIINPSFAEAISYMDMCKVQERVGFDIEVYNHQVSCFSLSVSSRECMSIPLTHNGDRWTDREECEIWLRLANILGDPRIATITQYGMFDISFILSQNRIRTRGRILDTYCAARILYPDFQAGLDFLTSIYTDMPYYKDDRKLWNRIREDPHTFWRYNARDSAVLPEIWDAQYEEMRKTPEYWRMYERTMELWDPCLYMMTRGIRIDVSRLKGTKEHVAEELSAKELQLREVAEVPFNPASPKQCIEYFYGTKGIRPYVNRKTGKPTCDDKAMTRILRRYNLKEAKLVQDIRGLKKLYNTYLDLEYDKDERLRCFYNPRGTVSGRLSSSKTLIGTGLNMQNLHPKFKGFLTVDEGVQDAKESPQPGVGSTLSGASGSVCSEVEVQE